MEPSKLMLKLDRGACSAYAWLEPRIVSLFGFELFRSYAAGALDDVVSKLMRDGDWYLWITDLQLELGMPDGTEPDLVLENDYRRVPVRQSWLDASGLTSLSYGAEFALTRGSGRLSASGLDELLASEQLPEGIEAALLFDPDIESFRAVFAPSLYDAGVETLSGSAHLTSDST